jgi:coenzyme F420-dependent glucose-6-phosphate dehydrogenase
MVAHRSFRRSCMALAWSRIGQDGGVDDRHRRNSSNTKISSCYIVAQVFATLGYMFPNRVFLGIGRGEALNEVPSGNIWPSSLERFKRMKEAIFLIKKLWNEEWVNFKGQYYWVRDSNLYTKSEKSIPIYIAASGRQSAQLAGEEGDGIVINEHDPGKIKDELIPAFENGAKKSGRDPEALERALFIAASYD